MSKILGIVSDFMWPVLILLSGLGIIYGALFAGQNGLWLFGGALLVLVGAFIVLMKLEMIGAGVQKMALFIFLPLAAVAGYFTYRSIREPIEFDAEKTKRYAKVVQALKDLRSAEVAFRAENNRYTANFDSLAQFVATGKFKVVKAIGRVPDEMTELEALKQGIIKRDTILINVKDSVFGKDFNFEALRIVPFSENVPFKMDAGIIIKGAVTVPVFEISCLNKDIFPGMEPRFFDPEKGLKVGSMEESSTSGNWE